ncbi:fructofuranosidase/invertase [Nonlabens sp. YIK11]|uniref:glycoside hydrolase 100 family protein n=1 Tax=Nonlabens sp. YIK11 TaxID=1453349 RepID=UPI0006DC7D20|nr:glycoside hydrolase 100 family protein [Nonlabens sp. YIK11]KQC32544.1 fructofuranosidase/invertase [Nonlabens sp. YIK11]
MEITQDPSSLLAAARSDRGFLASASDISNYKRIWARDGVICGLAALLDGDDSLIATFKSTLETLASHQHELGHIPSNVHFKENGSSEVSFGGLAGRVDTISWFIIGVCNYASHTGERDFFKQMLPKIHKGLQLLKAWEFNNNHLIYVPRSGNWADEYITEGHIFYDQVLRLWALRCVHSLEPSSVLEEQISTITTILEGNYTAGNFEHPFHPRAYKSLEDKPYWMASINPSGYQTMFDALGNSIALLLGLGSVRFRESVITYSEQLRSTLPLNLLPAFWEPIQEGDKDWELLTDNCKYEFRNYAYEFHNGGTWQMVNGFYGMALAGQHKDKSQEILAHIKQLNSAEDYGYYENFNTQTTAAIGIKYCTWSAAGEILLREYINGKRLLS